jgi:hypothetical protein
MVTSTPRDEIEKFIHLKTAIHSGSFQCPKDTGTQDDEGGRGQSDSKNKRLGLISTVDEYSCGYFHYVAH